MNTTKKSLAFQRINYLRGPNIWTYRPVIEAWVDIGELEDFPSNTLPGLYERLTSWLPGLVEHRCGVGERGGFLQRLREGTWAAHILEHVAIELQNLAGMQVGFGKARSTSQRGVYKVAMRARNEQVGRAAIQAGKALLEAAINDTPFDLATTVEQLREIVDDHHLGPSTACIVDAATDRRIPSIRLNEGNLVQLGYGSRQRRMWTAESDRTSAIAESIASDKDLTKGLLAPCGVPVPEGQIVASPDEAWEAAQDIGLPVVVKPSDANHGRGVSLELNGEEEIKAAFHIADAEGSDVIVERYIRGCEHRLLVVGGKVVAAGRGENIYITGDGKSTVRALIDSQLNSDPRRGVAEEFPLETIVLDKDQTMQLLLQRQGLNGESVPAAGQRVTIQRNGNVSIDCTDEVHPENAATASLAARIVGLDIAGIDLVCEDVSRPLHEQGGAIVEVNAGPGLLMHLKPAQGKPRPVGEAIVDYLFPRDENGRIPLVGITGHDDTTLIARIITWLLHIDGRIPGLACRDGLFLDLRQVDQGDSANWKAGQRLLFNRVVQAAVFETPAESILGEGLPYDRCDVGVVTTLKLTPEIEGYDVCNEDQLKNVLRTQVDVVWPEGAAVLNADEEAVADLAELCDGAVLFYSLNASNTRITEHLADNGRAVFIEDGAIVLARGTERKRLSAPPLDSVAATLAAAATAWAMGVAPELINTGIGSFANGFAIPVNATSPRKRATR